MRSFIYIAVSAFAAFAAAQTKDNAFNVPKGGYEFTAGEPTNLNWDPTTSGTITLKLQTSTDITPESGEVIATSIPNSGSFSFVPPNSLEPGTQYTVEIIDDNNPDNYNFTPLFNVENPNSSATTSAASTTESETATTSAASTTSATETETGTETTTTDASTTGTTGTETGTTMVTTSSASGSTASSTSTKTGSESESASGTSTAEPTVQTTTAPGAGVSLKVHGGMFALVAAVMASL